MRLTVQLALFLGTLASSALARTWSGDLVDAKCYAAEERNVNPTDTETAVDRDRGFEIRYCAPQAKTKTFALVEPDGGSLDLDPAGNAKASQLVQATGKEHFVPVVVSGDMAGKAIRVDSISAAK
jgi:hypothetical protein